MDGIWFVVMLALAFGLIAVAATVVPAVFRNRHQRREVRDMLSLQTGATSSEETTPSPRAERVIDSFEGKQDALGWGTNKGPGHSDSILQHSGTEYGAVLGCGKTILVADDDPVVLFAISRRLQQMGYQVMRSPDASHALLGAMKVLPDLIILDVNMPAGNGLAVCEMMACDQRCSHIPVIVHSVLSDDAIKRRCQRLGAHYVEKSPQSWDQIKTLVQSLLGGHVAAADDTAGIAAHSAEQAEQPEQTAQAEHAEEAEQAEHAEQTERAAETEQVADVTDTEEPRTISSMSQCDSSDAVPPPALTRPVSPTDQRRLVLCIESPTGRLDLIEHNLAALGIEVLKSSDVEEGFWTCFTEKPCALIVQIADGKNGLLGLLARLAEHPVTRSLPVFVINENNVIAAHELPSSVKVKIVKYPVDWEGLLVDLQVYFPAFHQDELTSPPSSSSSAKLPLRKDKQPAVVESKPAASDANDRLTILCIDDDPVVARSISHRLQPYPINLKWAKDGTEGYLAAIDHPDLILLDLKLPNGDGAYVLGKIKTNARTKSIPVIVLTVETNPGARRQMLSMGADVFISKPIDWHVLFEAMGRCVRLPKQLLDDYKIKDALVLAEL